MTEKNQAAFPVNGQPPIYTLPNGTRRIDTGLTKREYFAAMVLQALLGSSLLFVEDAAKEAVKIADDLILELNK